VGQNPIKNKTLKPKEELIPKFFIINEKTERFCSSDVRKRPTKTHKNNNLI